MRLHGTSLLLASVLSLVLGVALELSAADSETPFIAPQKIPEAEVSEMAAVESAPSKAVPAAVNVSAEHTPDKAAVDTNAGGPQVRLIGIKTDVAKRYRAYVPAFPFKPFTSWRKWFTDHADAVHCSLEWRDENGKWWHGEMHSTQFDEHSKEYRVGYGEFPCTAYDAYGIYIRPGREPRDIDHHGEKIEVTIDEEVRCDYHQVEAELRRYAAKDARPGDPGTGGTGHENVGLGGPAYKPGQNSNTMINYILRKCGVQHKAPDLAVGWDREPHFPYSSDPDSPKLDSTP